MKLVHFIGIGGIGMSGIARMYLSRGWSVRGSDLKRSDVLDTLEAMGARVLIGHDPSNVDGADLVVFSSSIPETHPERAAAVRKGLKVIHRAEALAEICRGKRTIAVTGTHGKTTTTALIGSVLREAGRDPSIVVGGLVISFGGNAYVGKGPEIVIEADESDSSFLKFSPDIEVITNIEAEHMDHFKSLGAVRRAYEDFVWRLPEEGSWFGCGEDANVAELARMTPRRRSSLYGFRPIGDGLWADDIVECPEGRRGVSFTVHRGSRRLGPVRLRIIGRHNVLNALAAASVGLSLGIEFQTVARALETYEGARRRFDVRHEDANFMVVDDYAHHPTELRKTLEAARGLKRKRLFAVFQPHRYTRTREFLADFGGSFGDTDKLIVTDVYAAGETPEPGVDGPAVSRAVSESGHPDASYVARRDLEKRVLEELKPGDLFIALGAGDIYQVAHRTADFLKGGLFTGLRGRVLRKEPLAKHTSLKVGGPAEFWIEPEDDEDLRAALVACREGQIPVTVFGSGSNMLPPDEGLPGAVIHLAAPYWKELSLRGEILTARAGVPNTLFIQFALEHGFGGCEFLLGIPGNIGGSVAMNAGSHNQSIDAYLVSLRATGRDGRALTLDRREVPFGYRTSGLRDVVITEASFALPKKDRAESQKLLDEYREYRQRTQDLQHPSAGCMFKNPQNAGCSSGKLIEDAGLKGRMVGRAQVSPKHANFIINLGGATAGDVRRLITEVRETVKKKYNVDLETEVKIL
ncbi:MAG TPA: UDP-N-acetylmuramate--L-alanine ligase [Candidatus Eisenbacteria bacterium]|nr:UDP-N-acetylmuramate--L-alanine ligase [Candidatus Eisenbacteria bacterium]